MPLQRCCICRWNCLILALGNYMKHIRLYTAWMMLIAAFTFAVPRGLFHECSTADEQHAQEDPAHAHDQFTHGDCSLCDFNFVSSSTPIKPLVLLAPSKPHATQVHCVAQLAKVDGLAEDSRGPPRA
jgi:hypothetical protein